MRLTNSASSGQLPIRWLATQPHIFSGARIAVRAQMRENSILSDSRVPILKTLRRVRICSTRRNHDSKGEIANGSFCPNLTYTSYSPPPHPHTPAPVPSCWVKAQVVTRLVNSTGDNGADANSVSVCAKTVFPPTVTGY